ncbi:MAG: hypothetical protein ACR5LA_06160 [Wolbachia sp.]
MKMKKLFAILLASSLASTASSGASELEDEYKYQYYAGLNFGAGWGNVLKIKPSVVFGYHHNKNSKFELEVLANISDITDKEKRKAGASLLANYRYYPELDIDPIKPYVSIGLGGYIQVLPSFGFGTDNKVTSDDDNKGNGGDTNPTISNDDNKGNGGDTNPAISNDDNTVNSTSQSSTLASKAAFSYPFIGVARIQNN